MMELGPKKALQGRWLVEGFGICRLKQMTMYDLLYSGNIWYVNRVEESRSTHGHVRPVSIRTSTSGCERDSESRFQCLGRL